MVNRDTNSSKTQLTIIVLCALIDMAVSVRHYSVLQTAFPVNNSLTVFTRLNIILLQTNGYYHCHIRIYRVKQRTTMAVRVIVHIEDSFVRSTDVCALRKYRNERDLHLSTDYGGIDCNKTKYPYLRFAVTKLETHV